MLKVIENNESLMMGKCKKYNKADELTFYFMSNFYYIFFFYTKKTVQFLRVCILFISLFNHIFYILQTSLLF